MLQSKADNPVCLQAAHQLHHADKYEGAPWGMFLSLQELEGIPGEVSFLMSGTT